MATDLLNAGIGGLLFLLIVDKLVNTFEYFITKQFD